MNQSRRFATALLSLAFCTLLGNTVIAQNDRLFVKGSSKAQIGTVLTVTKDGVQLKIGANNQAIPAADIEKIIFQNEESGLTKGRQFAVDNQYAEAISEIEKVDIAKLPTHAKADAAYYLMHSRAKLALGGQGDKNKAIVEAIAFAGSYSNSWHFFDTAKILGDLSLAIKDNKKALQFYGYLGNAKSRETKIESAYLIGIAKLSGNDFAGAMADFEKIIGIPAAGITPGTLRLQTLAKAGKAVALAKSSKGADGLKLVNSLIETLNPTDVEMAARIYNAQGASYEASGDTEGAIIAYLHTHLMFSTQPDAHAEALVRLVELWPKVGKPERAAEARQELQQRYPGFGK